MQTIKKYCFDSSFDPPSPLTIGGKINIFNKSLKPVQQISLYDSIYENILNY